MMVSMCFSLKAKLWRSNSERVRGDLPFIRKVIQGVVVGDDDAGVEGGA